jgi:hypothetical protein
VTVLEAQAEAGGRAATDQALGPKHGGRGVHTGGAWVHGAGGNPLVERHGTWVITGRG